MGSIFKQGENAYNSIATNNSEDKIKKNTLLIMLNRNYEGLLFNYINSYRATVSKRTPNKQYIKNSGNPYISTK